MANPLRVLIVEDSDDDAILLLHELRRGNYQTVHERVETAEAMREALEHLPWDLVISDYVLPSFSGLAALNLLRESGLDLPFILVSGKIGEDRAVEMMKSGAHDYILKGNLSRLIPAIERELQEAAGRQRRRIAELALSRSEERYRRLVSAVTDYVYSVEIMDGEVTRTSHGPGCFAVTGYHSEDFEANPLLWHQMIVDEDRTMVMEHASRVLSGKEVPSLEHRIIRKGGSICWVRNTIAPRRDERGVIVAYDGLIADITERKLAEEKLRIQGAALDAAANAILIISRDGTITWANRSFTSLSGFPLEEVVGQNVRILKSGQHDSSFYREIWDTITAGNVWHGELINRRRDGSFYPEEETIAPVPDERGVISYFIAIKQDITERKNAEKARMENERMLRDMELAQQIQRSLLPATPPDLPGISIACRCQPAAHVGGDYYDFFVRENGSVDLVIADVSGHNIGPALIMAETRSALRAEVHSNRSAGEILSALNDILHEDLTRAGLFITMFYLTYEPECRRLTYANAGHNRPLLLPRGADSCRELDAEGLIIGIKEGVEFEEMQAVLGAGDTLLLYTDGIVETENAEGELFGTERLCRLMANHQQQQPEDIINIILKELAEFASSDIFRDDISMIVVRAVNMPAG